MPTIYKVCAIVQALLSLLHAYPLPKSRPLKVVIMIPTSASLAIYRSLRRRQRSTTRWYTPVSPFTLQNRGT